MTNVIKDPTRLRPKSATLIDVSFTKMKTSQTVVEHTHKSDYAYQICYIESEKVNKSTRPRYKRDFSEANLATFVNTISLENCVTIYDRVDLDGIYANSTPHLATISTAYLPIGE